MSWQQQQQDIPIDIQYNKLVEWLISRRHCNIKWQTSAQVVKSKIVDALKDMPGTKEMKELLQGSYPHYYKCKQIVDLLKDTEKDTKNIFGRYSSQRMKDWQEIMKLYEKENLHLAELSSRLLRNVSYEIPETKKQIAKCGQMQQECEKKMKDCERKTDEVERNYSIECGKIGIEGKQVKYELIKLAEHIGVELDEIAVACKQLLPIVEYYMAFVEFTVGSDKFNDEITPISKHISKYGNTTVYQWKYGKIPDKIIRNDKQFDQEEENTIEDQIDWGFDGDVTSADDVIDFDIDVDDCGIVVEDESGNNENNGFEIVSVSDLSQAAQHADESYEVAENDEADTILENLQIRTDFINELIELRAFLLQRQHESSSVSGGDNLLQINQFQQAPSVLQLTSLDEIELMTSQVDDVYNRLTSTRLVYLCRILDSPKFVERLASTLKRQLALTSKYENEKMNLELRISESIVEEQNLYPKLQSLIAETKEWRKLIEKEIARLYNGRRVNLMGAINFISE